MVQVVTIPLFKGWKNSMFDLSILKSDEKAIFTMRDIFVKNGYRQFKMSKFEEYDLYSENKDFLVSDGVITFNDTNGKLLALKPDVTLSIIKNSKDLTNNVEKYFYNENVYRISESSKSYKEIMQTGLECIGDITTEQMAEVVCIALKCLSVVSNNCVLQLSHVGLVNSLLNDYNVEEKQRKPLLVALSQKNTGKVKELLSDEQFNSLSALLLSYNGVEESILAIEKIALSENSKVLVKEFKCVCNSLINGGYSDKIEVDFSVISIDGYYSGIIFKGLINGIASKVLSGGQYDNLMKKMGKKAGAIGFAVYLDTLERFEEKPATDDFINVALPKGRLGEKVYQMFENAGFDCPSIKENNRKLTFENKEKGLRFFWVKPSDVTIYVERGSADIGVAGKDILLEYNPDVYELLDLNIGKCRMAVASKKDFIDDESKTLRVATKFSKIAKDYYAKKCRDIDIIHLNGSIEIAPLLGLSDVIVDIVETGKTLLENDLVPFETIVPISARLIANKASFGFKSKKIMQIEKGLSNQVKQDD